MHLQLQGNYHLNAFGLRVESIDLGLQHPLHTALAVFGCLLGYTKISDEMKDAELRKMVERIGYTEGLPVVVDPGILDPKEFIDTVLNVRIPNPFMPDTPQRIATDTSQKLAIRFGETVKNYLASKDKDIKNLKLIPLVFAGWLRYLMAVDDNGEKFELSPDPLLEKHKRVFVMHGEDEVENIFVDTLTGQGFTACAPYNGAQWAIGAEGAVCLQEGTKVRVEQRTGEGANRAATVFQRLLSAGKRLLRVIEHNEGGANKDLAKFADQINALCDKWDR